MLNIVDEYYWSEHRKTLTPKETGIEALKIFGYYTNNRADEPLETHIHENCMEIVFLIKGFQMYVVGDNRFNMTGSNVFVTYPNEPHSSGECPQSKCDIIWLQIDFSEGIPFFGLDEKSARELRNALLSLPRIFDGSQDLQSLLTDAFFAITKKDPLNTMLAQHLLVCALIKMKQLSEQATLQQMDSIDNAIAYIHDNISEPIRLEDAADMCGLSLSRFKVKFREETGTTPRDYINRVKIEKSKLMLKDGQSVTDTALSLGFTTPNYFSVQFKKYTGKTPTEFCENSGSPEDK